MPPSPARFHVAGLGLFFLLHLMQQIKNKVQVHFSIPFRNDKNLGKAYNDAMKSIPENDHGCLIDYDVMFLTPEQPKIIEAYAERYPDALLTCYTNRIHPKSHQSYHFVNDDPDIRKHLKLAKHLQEENAFKVTPIHEHMSGFLMCLSKQLWNRFKFEESGKCLGVDTAYFNLLRQNKVPVLRMDAIYVWHTYRLLTGITDKRHLL